jgi:hypothetical protein
MWDSVPNGIYVVLNVWSNRVYNNNVIAHNVQLSEAKHVRVNCSKSVTFAWISDGEFYNEATKHNQEIIWINVSIQNLSSDIYSHLIQIIS